MGFLRRLCRLPLVLLHVLFGGLAINLAVRWDRLRGLPSQGGVGRFVQKHWCRAMLRLIGVRLEIEGEPAPPPVLVASNHISWLDIVVIAAACPVAFLSKSEIARWPIIGRSATGLGTLYIERGRRDAASRAVEAMAGRLRDSDRVLFFPEGTTGDGTRLLPLRPRLFQAAVDADAVVQPLTLLYLDPDGSRSPQAPFIGEQTLLGHVWRLVAQRRLIARVHFGEPLAPPHEGRSALSQRCERHLRAVLDLSDSAP